jgi:hypothetical protein
MEEAEAQPRNAIEQAESQKIHVREQRERLGWH